MKNPVNRLLASLEDAIDLIDDSHLLPNGVFDELTDNSASPLSRLDFSKASSLMEKCENVESQFTNEKPVLRIIHHLACSGGTLISKCLSAIPNVFLLSELHPYSDLHLRTAKPKFSPSDIASLSKYAQVPEQRQLAQKLFAQSVKLTFEHVDNRAGTLILRDHTHSDYNLGSLTENGSEVVSALKDDFEIRSIVTVRNPIDAYASLVKNNWQHFEPFTFDEYCRRLNRLLCDFSHCPIIKFEDFTHSPISEMHKICKFFEIPFSEEFESLFELFNVTGDSGRSANVIGVRERIAPPSIIEESLNSPEFNKICNTGLYQLPQPVTAN
ncbi:sulfotransferase [Aliiglaciecola litoralis]|uniref:Sulfotransferase family protein n=1 Tax=Aliiglaciecola litoralis TaxID=582857 RepID=A0ABN1LJA3_9ALTE